MYYFLYALINCNKLNGQRPKKRWNFASMFYTQNPFIKCGFFSIFFHSSKNRIIFYSHGILSNPSLHVVRKLTFNLLFVAFLYLSAWKANNFIGDVRTIYECNRIIHLLSNAQTRRDEERGLSRSTRISTIIPSKFELVHRKIRRIENENFRNKEKKLKK